VDPAFPEFELRRFLTIDDSVERIERHTTPRFPEQRLDACEPLNGSRTSRVSTQLTAPVVDPCPAQLDGRGIAPHSPRPSSPPPGVS
jgi:hypothetical protein